MPKAADCLKNTMTACKLCFEKCMPNMYHLCVYVDGMPVFSHLSTAHHTLSPPQKLPDCVQIPRAPLVTVGWVHAQLPICASPWLCHCVHVTCAPVYVWNIS